MTSSEIQLEVFDEQKPLNSEDKKDDMKKNNISRKKNIILLPTFFLMDIRHDATIKQRSTKKRCY
jgi:hypothetical protein